MHILDNNLLGNSGRIYKPLSHLIRNYISKTCLVFKCQHNQLHSQAFCLISESLAYTSSLTHLDLSNNLGGLDPYKNQNSEGIDTLARMLINCHTLKILKLANNHMSDEDIVRIAESVLILPNMRELDVSNNFCYIFGILALKDAILSHAAMKSQ